MQGKLSERSGGVDRLGRDVLPRVYVSERGKEIAGEGQDVGDPLGVGRGGG